MKAAVVATTTVLSLTVCEAFMRIAGLAPPVYSIWLENEDSFYQHSNNPALPYELKPGFSRDLHTGATSVNAHGMRDRNRSIDKPPGVKRVILLGDSVVEGIRVHSDEATIARKLEKSISDDSTEVLNLAVTGYNTLAEVELLRATGLKFDPDVVVLVFVRNDFENASLSPDSAAEAPPRPAWVKKLFLNSHLWRHLCLRFHWWEFGRESEAFARSAKAREENNVVTRLRTLRQLANEHRFQVLVAIWPEFGDNGLIDPHPVAEDAEELIVELLAEAHGFPTTRLSPAFRQDWKQNHSSKKPRLHYTSGGDGMHPLEHGSEIAADAIRAALETLSRKPPYPDGAPDERIVRAAEAVARQSTGGASESPKADNR